MQVSFSTYSGDGVNNTMIDIDVLLPDSGTTVTVAGQIRPVSTSGTGLNALIPVGGR